jgi:hypothetical protein
MNQQKPTTYLIPQIQRQGLQIEKFQHFAFAYSFTIKFIGKWQLNIATMKSWTHYLSFIIPLQQVIYYTKISSRDIDESFNPCTTKSKSSNNQ